MRSGSMIFLCRLRRAGALILLGGVIVALYVVTGLTLPINFHDEGFPVYAAVRVLEGEVPYRDFWSVHPPGQWYTLAAVFKLFGTSLLVERIWDALVRVALLYALYAFASRLTSSRTALVPGVVLFVYLGVTPFYAYMMFPALLLSLLSGFSLLAHVADPRARWPVAAGLCAGLAALYRHDVGFYVAAAGGVVLAVWALGDRREATGVVRALVPFAAGAAAVVMPAAVALLSAVPASVLWDQIFVYSFTVAPSIGYLPLPPLLVNPLLMLGGEEHLRAYLWFVFNRWIPFYFPLVTCALGVVVSVKILVGAARGRDPGVSGWGTLWLTLFGALLLLQAARRFDAIHLMPTTLVAIVLLTVLTAWGWQSLRRVPMLMVMCLGLPLLSVSMFWMPAMDWIVRTYRGWPPNCSRSPEFARARCMPLRADQAAIIQLVQNLTRPTERIFVGHARHDRIFLTDVLFYFVSERESATRHFWLEPGIATTEAVQKEIVQELIQHRVRIIVLYSPLHPFIEPNEGGRSSGVTVLDDYIRSAYRKGWVSGEYSVWEKR
jgi:4-amino-4-deoxy-L-arabinose transferase-like glycosyltransferase